ncbi:MAG: PAS domain-containing protein [Eubacterium sp.]|nr:PAS domain-containing protein [Eubacterium sp.]
MDNNIHSAFEVAFMSCVADKAADLTVLESDQHFAEFTGVHPSKIKQGKLSLMEKLNPQDREAVMRQLKKKDARYIYINFYLMNKDGEPVYIHCLAQNIEGTTHCRLTMADISASERKSRQISRRAESMNQLIDLVEGGVCLFKVNRDMHFEVLYMNKACARMFGTYKNIPVGNAYRLDELLHKDDKSTVFQAIGSAMATKKAIDLEVRVQTHHNEYTWCKLNSAIHRYDEDGNPVFHAVFTDITKIKAAEQEADTERDLMVNIFKNLPGPLFCADPDAPFLVDVASEDFMRLIGYSREEFFEVMGGDLTRLMDADAAPAVEQQLIADAQEHHVVTTTYSLTAKDGKSITVVDRRRVVDNENGEPSMFAMLKKM